MSKKFPKIFTVIFLSLLILQTGAFVFSALFYTPTKAAAKWTNPTDHFQLATFSTPAACPDDKTKTCVPWIGEYIAGIYKYAIGIVGILAAVVLMFGGVVWLTAGGNQNRIGEAKSWIGASLTGLILALTSYMILYEINPDLVKMNPLKISVISELKVSNGDCKWKLVGSANATCDTGYEKAEDSACNANEKPQGSSTGAMGGVIVSTYPICCCAACKQNITCQACNSCISAADSDLLCKESPCLVNNALASKLAQVKLSESDWRITEGWPPTINHLDSCHQNGTCADINFLNNTDDPEAVAKLYKLFTDNGLKAVYEHSNCSAYTAKGVNCKMYSTTTSHSFHVEL